MTRVFLGHRRKSMTPKKKMKFKKLEKDSGLRIGDATDLRYTNFLKFSGEISMSRRIFLRRDFSIIL